MTREPDDEELDGISLEELGAAYARAMQQGEDDRGTPADHPADDSEAGAGPAAAAGLAVDDGSAPGIDRAAVAEPDAAGGDENDSLPTPLAIIEAALFIGNPENRGITEAELASLMRDVTAEEVAGYVDRLNQSYQENDQALRIHRDEDGLRMGVSPDMEIVRRAFYGKIRETRLSQAAIEVLSLVAYQPGITADQVQDQRGKESASLLSQLVRRRLLQQRRVACESSKRPVATYYPTERFLQLVGLQSLDDLPQVEPTELML